MVSAVRQGLPTVYGGVLGTGPFAMLAERALHTANIVVASPPEPQLDTGIVICLIEATGERTFVTSPGAESHLTAKHLSSLNLGAGDLVYLSGYSLLYPSNRDALMAWLPTLAPNIPVIFDPGPLVADIPQASLDLVLANTHWLTANAREAFLMSGQSEARQQARQLSQRTGHRQVIVRHGPKGCLIVTNGSAPTWVPGYPVPALDSNGAGDAHTGAFLAALSMGQAPWQAARFANAAAAIAVTRFGPATAPTRDEVITWLEAPCPPEPSEPSS
jgi:sugar/nucleoside kinase (ribokinase family)